MNYLLKKIIIFILFLSSQCPGLDTLLDTQYVVIDIIDSYEITLSSNFSYIQAHYEKKFNTPGYFGECTNNITITANSPVLLEVSLGQHSLTNCDCLDLKLSAPKNGLTRSVRLWDGAAAAVNEQIAQNVEGENIEFRINLKYFGNLQTPHNQKGAWLFFTITADDENF